MNSHNMQQLWSLVQWQRGAIEELMRGQRRLRAQNIATRAALTALLYEHPAPSALLQRYLGELDRAADLAGDGTQVRGKDSDTYRTLLVARAEASR